MGSVKKLTTRQARFAEEYGVDGNATQAAIRAGYSARCAKEQGYRLLTNAHVLASIKKQAQKVSARLGIDRERVMRQLVHAARQAILERDAGSAIMGWREIARIMGLYPNSERPTPEVRTVRRQLAPDFRLLSDEQLTVIADGDDALLNVSYRPAK